VKLKKSAPLRIITILDRWTALASRRLPRLDKAAGERGISDVVLSSLNLTCDVALPEIDVAVKSCCDEC